jgi:O26-antigen biosynthesis N-acetyl-L-fucosamine transferase
MRIALLPDEYLPSGTRVHSKMIHELALFLMESGHEPIIITPGSPEQRSRLVVDCVDGVEVWRFKSGYTRGVGMTRRALNEWLLSFRAWLAIKSKVKAKKIDLCINYAPTIFFGPLARRFKMQGSYVYLIVRDMFPQWIIDQGLIKEKSVAASFFRYYEKLNYSAADCIGVQSQANLDVFTNKFPTYGNVKILRNWAATAALPAAYYNKKLGVKLGIKDKVIFFYGGNIGHAQDMTNIMRLARNLKSTEEAHFLIIGQGDEVNLIHDLKIEWELDNVTILPSMSQREFSGVLAMVDVGLFSLSYRHTAHNFPGKLLGYMVESKPILGSVNPGNDLLEIVNTSNSGLVFVNGEDKLLSDAAIKLVFDEKFRTQCGSNARALLLREFSVESAAEGILSAMKGRA